MQPDFFQQIFRSFWTHAQVLSTVFQFLGHVLLVTKISNQTADGSNEVHQLMYDFVGHTFICIVHAKNLAYLRLK